MTVGEGQWKRAYYDDDEKGLCAPIETEILRYRSHKAVGRNVGRFEIR